MYKKNLLAYDYDKVYKDKDKIDHTTTTGTPSERYMTTYSRKAGVQE